MRNLKSTKAITLVALIITIIVLLILAMVSISLVMNGGIIDRADRSVKTYSDEEIGEQLKLAYSEYQTARFTRDVGDAKTFIEGRLQSLFGNDNVTKVLIEDNKLITTIKDKKYIYNIDTGISAEYIDPFNYGEKTKATVEAEDDITLGTEKFKVISNTNGTILAMPYYNLVIVTATGVVKQGPKVSGESTEISSTFSTTNYWTQGEGAINMSDPRNNIQQYIIEYKRTLESLGADAITVRAARKSDFSTTGITGLMRNPGQSGSFWYGYSFENNSVEVWRVHWSGAISHNSYEDSYGVRPIVVIF